MSDAQETSATVAIEPAEELCFTGPFTESTSSIITVTNTSDRKIAFKVKTTAPRQYCVRPNSGFIAPKEMKEIKVILQPMPDYDPFQKVKHKFMVQTMNASGDDIDVDSVWKAAPNSSVTDYKLKCAFKLPNSDEECDNERMSASGRAELLSEQSTRESQFSDQPTTAVENARRVLQNMETQNIAESKQQATGEGFHSTGVLDCLYKLLQDHNAVMVIIFVFIVGFITGVVFT